MGQQHGQLILGNGNYAAFVAINHGDGSSPIALTGNQPVTQPIVDHAPAYPLASELSRDGFTTNLRLHTGKFLRVYNISLLAVSAITLLGAELGLPGFIHSLRILKVDSIGLKRLRLFLTHDNMLNGQAAGFGKIPVALVTIGNGHDGTRAVTH